MNRILTATVVLAVLTTVLVVVGIAGYTATATGTGDDAVAVAFEPDSMTVEPGETVEVAVTLQSEGGHDGEGLYRAEVRIAYPTEYVEVTDLDVGPWFHQDGKVELSVQAWVDDEAGVARLDQRMRDPEMGVSGADRIATVTLRVSEDAEPATVELDATESAFFYAITNVPVPVFGTPAELDISGGGERVQPAFDEEYDIEESESAAPLAVSANDYAESGDSPDTDDGDTEDPETDDGDASDADDNSPDADETGAGDESMLPIFASLGVGAVIVMLATLLYVRR